MAQVVVAVWPPTEGLMVYEGHSFIDSVALLFAPPQRIICFFSTTVDACVASGARALHATCARTSEVPGTSQADLN